MPVYTLRCDTRDRVSGGLDAFTLDFGHHKVGFAHAHAIFEVSDVRSDTALASVLRAKVPAAQGTSSLYDGGDQFTTVAFFGDGYSYSAPVSIATAGFMPSDRLEFKLVNTDTAGTSDFMFTIKIKTFDHLASTRTVVPPDSVYGTAEAGGYTAQGGALGDPITHLAAATLTVTPTVAGDGDAVSVSQYEFDQAGVVSLGIEPDGAGTAWTGVAYPGGVKRDHTFSGLADGAYTVRIKHTNAHGVGSATTSFAVAVSTGSGVSGADLALFRGMYSLYKRSSHGGAHVRLRRASDNAEQDFTFDASGDPAAVVAWAGGATAYMVTWYDQSGQGNNAHNAAAGEQAIYDPVLKRLDFSSTGRYYPLPDGTIPYAGDPGGTSYTIMACHGSIGTTNGTFVSAGINQVGKANALRRDNGGYNHFWWSYDLKVGSGYSSSGGLVSCTYDGTTRNLYNSFGAVVNTDTPGAAYNCTSTNNRIGNNPTGAWFTGTLYEVWIANADLGATKIGGYSEIMRASYE